MKYTFYMNEWDFDYEKVTPGDAVLVYTKENLNTGETEWKIGKRFADSGYPGNLDPSARRFHGWRGTTNNIYVEAHGVYTIKSVERASNGVSVKVVINRTDIKRNEE